MIIYIFLNTKNVDVHLHFLRCAGDQSCAGRDADCRSESLAGICCGTVVVFSRGRSPDGRVTWIAERRAR